QQAGCSGSTAATAPTNAGAAHKDIMSEVVEVTPATNRPGVEMADAHRAAVIADVRRETKEAGGSSLLEAQKDALRQIPCLKPRSNRWGFGAVNLGAPSCRQ
ncbi:unnamed protein product, partial [Amoebophrya sp. A120]